MTLIRRAEALFSSSLQPSDRHTAEQLRSAIVTSIRSYRGIHGCEAMLAMEYGEHPEAAANRMRWALAAAASV